MFTWPYQELENMEMIEEQPDEDVSDSEPEQQQQQQQQLDEDEDDESSVDQEMEDEVMEEDNHMEEEEEEEESDEDEENDANSESAEENATSDDNDDDDDDEQDTKDSRKKLVSDIEKHKKELEKLKKSDPEFYKYLQKEENNLLEFDESADDVPDDEEQEDDEDVDMDDAEASESESEASDQEEEQADPFGDDLELLTKKKVAAMIEQVDTKKSLPAMKKLLLAFKTAARMSDEEQQEGVSFVYKIQDPKGN